MSSTPYGEPLDLPIRPSRLVATLLCGIHLTAAVVCVEVPAPFTWRAALLLAVISAFFWNAFLYARRTPKRISWSLEQGWRLTSWKGMEEEMELLPEAYIGPWLMIAHFRDGKGKRRSIMLARDSASMDGLRRFRMLLRYGTPKR